MDGTTSTMPDQYTESLSEEAKLLLKWCPLEWCMSFVYDTGYVACTEHCCNHNGTQREKLFVPRFDLSAQPTKCVNASAKLSQWFIPDNMRIPRMDGSQDVVVLEGIDITLSDYWAAKLLENREGEDLVGIIDLDLSTVPPHMLAPVSTQCAQLIRRRGEHKYDPTLAQRTRDLTEKRNYTRWFMEKNILLSQPPAWLADTVFWSRPANGFDEVAKAYLAWRKIWFTFVFREGAEPVSARIELLESSIQHILPILHPWGDVRNDYNLYHYGELTRKDLRYTYEQEPEALYYLLANNTVWKKECEILDNYVGLRREMHREQFHRAKRAAQRAGTAMDNLVQAETKMKTDPNKANECANKVTRQKMLYIAKSRFLEIEHVYLKEPIPGIPSMEPAT
ncbi:hypothetical protein B0J13DRAFT_633615 [Dactylonectria estremocensis]|uniref:Uncharacterized protein n=1 Tax=Dactylonectria estremocensis TaxID=1079267 RepID=A0A9P9FI40_9HYPO|nr:hypothetical protein B0J13DRAFT_633615 [Dactylonectria estremocensis]